MKLQAIKEVIADIWIIPETAKKSGSQGLECTEIAEESPELTV